MEISNEFILKDSLIKLDKTYTIAFNLYKSKEFEQSFKTIASVSIFLGILNKLDPYKFVLWKIKILGIQYAICFNQKKPDYNNYLFYFTSLISYEVLHQLAQLPTNKRFYDWKVQFFKNPSEFFHFKDNHGFDTALTELNLINHKEIIFERIYNFCFESLPLLYGIRPEFLNPIALDKYFNEKIIELAEVVKEFEELTSKDLSLINVTIGISVREIYQIIN